MKYQRHLVKETNEFKKKEDQKIIVVAGACLNDEWIKVH